MGTAGLHEFLISFMQWILFCFFNRFCCLIINSNMFVRLLALLLHNLKHNLFRCYRWSSGSGGSTSVKLYLWHERTPAKQRFRRYGPSLSCTCHALLCTQRYKQGNVHVPYSFINHLNISISVIILVGDV